MRLAFVALLLVASNSKAGEIILRDSECKILGGAKESVVVMPGEKAEYTCVIIENEATCNYRNQGSGESQGQPTKYEIVDSDAGQVWSSLGTGNIKLLVNLKKGTFSYGMAAVLPAKGMLITKHCVGKVLRTTK